MTGQEYGFWSWLGSFFVRWGWFIFIVPGFFMGVLLIKDKEYIGGGLYIFAALSLLIPFFIFIYPDMKNERLEKKLRVTGIRTTAEILSVRQTGKYVNEMPYFRLQLKYSVHGKEVVKHKFDVLVEYTEFGVFIPGEKLELLVDPDNVQNVVLEPKANSNG